MRGVKWFFADVDVGYVYIGRHVLAALGLNNCKLLAAAADRLNGVADTP